MFTRNWPRHLLCLSLSLPLGSALACGPDFPMRLLDNRGQSLAELPEGNFRFRDQSPRACDCRAEERHRSRLQHGCARLCRTAGSGRTGRFDG